jgi:Glycosyl transferases group 1
MRLFQNSGIYPSYLPRLRSLDNIANSFAEKIGIFLDDRFGALHFLQPVLDRSPEAFFTNGDDPIVQRLWSREHGLASSTSLENILLAQIESHRTEVFYNMDPMRYGSAFIKRLPGCVKKTIAWRAAPSAGGDFGAHDLIVCNFPTILQSYRDIGWKAAYFFPGHDPEMDRYAAQTDRPTDVLFVGGYSRHHRQRALVLEAVATLQDTHNVVFHLDRSRMTQLAETPLGWWGPLAKHRRSDAIRKVTHAPVFGRQLYEALGQAKVVVNGAVDMAGNDRGNMRCWEAMGCGALLMSDDGNYPDGMNGGEHFLTYKSAADAVQSIKSLMGDRRNVSLALTGHSLVSKKYSKLQQWLSFCDLA